jgi:hypothetical protein
VTAVADNGKEARFTASWALRAISLGRLIKSEFLDAGVTSPWGGRGGGVWQRRTLNELSKSTEFSMRES